MTMCQAACQPVLGEISRTVPHDMDKHASAPAGGVRAREHSGQAEPGSTADEPRSPLPAPARKQGYEKWPEPTRPGRAATLARVLETYEYDKTQTVNSLLSRGSLLNAVDGAVAFERCPGQGRSATAEDLTPYTTRQLSGRLGGLASPGRRCRPAPAVGPGHRGSPGVLSARVTRLRAFASVGCGTQCRP